MLLQPANRIWLGGGLGLEPVRKHHFELRMTDNRGRAMPDLGQFAIQSIPEVANQTEVIAYVMANSAFPVPGTKGYGVAPFCFRATTDSRALDYFRAWRRDVYNPETDEVGLYGSVIGEATVLTYGPADVPGAPPTLLRRRLRMMGIYPVDVVVGQWDMDGDGHQTFHVHMAVTDAYME